MSNLSPPYDGTDAYVFICYSHADERAVHEEIAWLQESGVNVWYDEQLTIGAVWRDEVAQRIEGASHVLFFVSPDSVGSRYCNQELDYAESEQKPILAIHLSETELPPGLKLSLNNRQHLLRFRSPVDEYQQRLLDGLSTPNSGSTTDRVTGRRWFYPVAAVLMIVFVVLLAYVVAQDEAAPSNSEPTTDVAETPKEVRIREIALVGLENLSGEEQRDFVRGMTLAIRDSLVKLRSLPVRDATYIGHDDPRGMAAVAQELGVDAVVSGSLTRVGDEIRFFLAMTDIKGRVLHSNTTDHHVGGYLSLQSEVAKAVAEEVQLALTPAELRLFQEPDIDPRSVDAYVRGRTKMIEESQTPWDAVRQDFEQAVDIDPEHAIAWAWLAKVHWVLASLDDSHYQQALDAAGTALKVDRSTALAHTVRGYVMLARDRNVSGAMTEIQLAMALNPRDAENINGLVTLLLATGQIDEALRYSDQMRRYYPRSRFFRDLTLMHLTFAGHYEQALNDLADVKSEWPEFQNTSEFGLWVRLDRFRNAYRALGECGVWCGIDQTRWTEAWVTGSWRGAGEWSRDESPLRENQVIAGFWNAMLGDAEGALDSLDSAYSRELPLLYAVGYFPQTTVLHGNSRFEKLLGGLGYSGEDIDRLARSPGVLGDSGRFLAVHGQPTEALRRLGLAIDLHPYDLRVPRWQYYRALAYFALADYGRAIELSQEALHTGITVHLLPHSHLLIATARVNAGQSGGEDALNLALAQWQDLQIKYDLEPMFYGGDEDVRDRYLNGLRSLGLR